MWCAYVSITRAMSRLNPLHDRPTQRITVFCDISLHNTDAQQKTDAAYTTTNKHKAQRYEIIDETKKMARCFDAVR